MPVTSVHMQYACFDCRKVFKKLSRLADDVIVCPRCSHPMTMMGKAFRAPKQSKLEQWKKAQLLAEAGIVFHAHSGPKPRALKDVADFLEARRRAQQSPGERLLERIKAGANMPAPRTMQQGRVKRLNFEGRPRFELLGRGLNSWSEVLVNVGGRWRSGYFGFTGDGMKSVEPYVRVNEAQDVPGRYVFIGKNTALRWPD